MISRWSDREAAACVARHAPLWGEPLAWRTHASRLLGAERELVLHGGGNTSVKGSVTTPWGETVEAIFVKASGRDLATIGPEDHTALDLTRLRRLVTLDHLDDGAMVNALRTHLFDAGAPTPSIEALMHLFLPHRYIDHTHADAILTLTNQPDGPELIRRALGEDVLVLPYVHPGFALAKAVFQRHASRPDARAMVLMHHGLITWGETARASYESTIDLVSRAEAFIATRSRPRPRPLASPAPEAALARYTDLAPVLRGALAVANDDQPDHPFDRFFLAPLVDQETLDLLASDGARELLLSPPLTSDHIIRTKSLPLWIDDEAAMRGAVADYREAYRRYLENNADPDHPVTPFDASPRVILMPGVGAICAGKTPREAAIARDIFQATARVKSRIAAMGGTFEGLDEKNRFAMEYFPLQVNKLGTERPPPLSRTIALITGAAGAIGSGICRELLANGCQVAAADLPGAALDSLAANLNRAHPGALMPLPMDVTSPEAVAAGFRAVVARWGGVDLVIPNAGLAHVAALEELNPETFRKLQRVNVDGTLLVLAEAARLFRRQGTGGDVVMISTKNVFAPGARFGAYSATKAAAHQLARIASLELAEIGVRVNLVAPDGVFADGDRPSGLWAEVGPDRMKARGLDADGLQEYYRTRNLLKARITATHVGRAVLFFATRQTPTTGATLPVDGGLPDATPR